MVSFSQKNTLLKPVRVTMAFLGKFAYIWLTTLSCYGVIPVSYGDWEGWYIRSNLRVNKNRRFTINPVYLGGGTMVVKNLEFRLCENLKVCSPWPFALHIYP